jgi:hypothetical protein
VPFTDYEFFFFLSFLIMTCILIILASSNLNQKMCLVILYKLSCEVQLRGIKFRVIKLGFTILLCGKFCCLIGVSFISKILHEYVPDMMTRLA